MDKLRDILVHAHSGLRWIVLVLLLLAVVQAFIGNKNKSEYTDKNRKINLFSMISFHLQFLLGLVLYFISDWVQFGAGTMSNAIYRFYSLEHITLMGLAMVLITVGYSKSKKAVGTEKFKKISIYYTLALLVILLAIPWPFRIEVAHWF